MLTFPLNYFISIKLEIPLPSQCHIIFLGDIKNKITLGKFQIFDIVLDGENKNFIQKEIKKIKTEDATEGEEINPEENDDDNSILSIKRVGSILRSGDGRLQNISYDKSGRVVALHGTDNMLELFVICTQEEIKKRLTKRAKKEQKRTGEEVDPESIKVTVQEQFKRVKAIKASGKIKSLSVINSRGSLKKDTAKVLMVLANNQIEVVKIDSSTLGSEAEIAITIENLGHKSHVRTLAFSSDNTAILTASSEGLKVWNRDSFACVRSIPCGNALACLFAPGDRHVLVGTKSGVIQIFDIGSGEMTEEIQAHNGEIWSLNLTPDHRSVVSGSGDKTVKFWDFEMIESDKHEAKILSILHKRSLELDEGVTCVCMTPDSRLIAVGLLDSTVKVFFMDSLKFFLSLYGHKLPVVCMDISSDSTVLATGSADRLVAFISFL